MLFVNGSGKNRFHLLHLLLIKALLNEAGLIESLIDLIESLIDNDLEIM